MLRGSRGRLAEIEKTLQRQRERIGEIRREVGRLGPQVAALEERVEDLAELLERREADQTFTADPTARDLLEQVRREHRQVRARVSAAVVFEERVRVLEERAGVDPPRTGPVGS